MAPRPPRKSALVASRLNGSTQELRLETIPSISSRKTVKKGLSQGKLSVLSLHQTGLTQDHEEQDRSKIMNNSTKQLIQLISKAHSI